LDAPRFLQDLAVVLGVASAVLLLFRRLGWPPVLGRSFPCARFSRPRTSLEPGDTVLLIAEPERLAAAEKLLRLGPET